MKLGSGRGVSIGSIGVWFVCYVFLVFFVFFFVFFDVFFVWKSTRIVDNKIATVAYQI